MYIYIYVMLIYVSDGVLASFSVGHAIVVIIINFAVVLLG